jgi:hypothetical protein
MPFEQADDGEIWEDGTMYTDDICGECGNEPEDCECDEED